MLRKVEVSIPESVSNYLPGDDEIVKKRLQRLLLLDLVGQGVISFGKAAELAGTDKISYITELGFQGIPYFNDTLASVLNDAAIVGSFKKG